MMLCGVKASEMSEHDAIVFCCFVTVQLSSDCPASMVEKVIGLAVVYGGTDCTMSRVGP
jgi:hypothetical protein